MIVSGAMLEFVAGRERPMSVCRKLLAVLPGPTIWTACDAANEVDNPFHRFVRMQALNVPGEDTSLRVWPMSAVQIEKQPCLLCECHYTTRAELLRHIDEEHGGLQRYRNTFLHLELLCPHVVRASEASVVQMFCYLLLILCLIRYCVVCI